MRIISTEEFNNKIMEIVKEQINIEMKVYERYKNLTRISLCGNKRVCGFLDWLYKDATIYLDRKFKLYVELKNKVI
jgi:ferritin